MKKYILNLVIPVLMLSGFAACSDWTETEPTIPINTDLAPKSPEYYAKLRDWKLNDKHPRTFGWYGNWTGKGASGDHRLMGLPDSVDFVSMWGNWWGLSPEQMRDKQDAYEIKGLRVKICFIIANIGDQLTPKAALQAKEEGDETFYEYDGKKYGTTEEVQAAVWGWYSNNETGTRRKDWYYDKSSDEVVATDMNGASDEIIEAAIQKYAQALTDTIIKYDFKGFDYDLERNYGAPGNIASHSNRITMFLKEMSKTCGPLSGTDRLLCVDGQPNILEPECAKMLDFFIMQAYYARNVSDLEGSGYTPRVLPVVNHFKEYFANEMGYGENATREIISRIILCEDFEQEPGKGGNGLGYSGPGPGIFTTRDGRKLPPVWGMADYFSEEGYQIGGCGIYHMEYDYPNTYSTISTIHKDNGMDLDPAKTNGKACYGYLNGIIQLLHNPVNPAANQTVE